jgi:hypothetical protein
MMCGVLCGVAPSREVQLPQLQHPVYTGSLVNDPVWCGVNISSQFLLPADIRAMIVVFVDADLRLRYM